MTDWEEIFAKAEQAILEHGIRPSEMAVAWKTGYSDGYHTGRAEEKADRDKLKACLGDLLPMTEELHRRDFSEPCDHDEYCNCDAQAQSSAAIARAKSALGAGGES